MKLDCVLTACNMNPLYLDFIPMYITAWNKLYPEVDVKIVLINETVPDFLDKYKNNIILFNPPPNISTAFISQYIRILYPSILNYKNGIIITDIDMIPMNNTYYTDNIKSIDDNKFVYYRDILLNRSQIAMCYNIALNKTWSEIFNINTLEDIYKRLIYIYPKTNYKDGHGNMGWSTDQRDLYKYVIKWNNKTNNFISLQDNITRFNRMSRGRCLPNAGEKIKSGLITDYHAYRPNTGWRKNLNEKLVSLLSSNDE
jgi:hypothetical protein